MNLVAPLSRIEEVEPLIRAGADEFYCGFIPSGWKEKYTNIASLNRCYLDTAQFRSFEELEGAVEIAHSYGVPVALALNELYYTQEQYPAILDLVKKVEDIGMDTLIVADIGLLLALRKMQIKAKMCMSSCGTSFNSEAVRFYSKLGVSRIILPAPLKIVEIAEMSKKTGEVEFEAFVFNERCVNIDGLCTFNHAIETVRPGENRSNACSLDYDMKLILGWQTGIELETVFNHLYSIKKGGNIDCGICALYDFNRIGIKNVKIVGRTYRTSRKLMDTSFVRTLIDYLETCPSRDKFIEYSKKQFEDVYGQKCRYSRCYYPEVI